MKRYECFEFLAPVIKDELVLGSLNGQRVEWVTCHAVKATYWWHVWEER
jgi:hypothetical protein